MLRSDHHIHHPIPKQAAFLRQTFLDMMESHVDATSPVMPEFLHFLESMNQFLQENNVEPIEASTASSVSPEFGHALVEFFNEVNHYPNPLNEPELMAEAEGRQGINRSLGQLYKAASDYLHALHIPIARKGVETTPDEVPQPDVRLWRRVVERAEDGGYQSRIEEVEQLDPSKKSVICVGGSASIHGHAPTINGLMRIAEKKLGGPTIYDEGVELYCVSYPAVHRPSFFADTHHYNADPEHYYSEPAKHFVDKLVMPGVQQLSHPDLQGVKDHFSNLNLFAYSYGTVFVQEIRNYLCQRLQEEGYGHGEIAEAFAEVYAMNIGPTCRLDVQKAAGNFSSVYVLSPEDLNVRSKTYNHVLANAMAASGKKMKAISDNELLIYSEAPLEGEFITPYDAEMAAKGGGGGGVVCKQNPSGHDVKFYTQSMQTSDGEAHIPRYLSYHMSSVLGTSGAYQEVDPRFFPPPASGEQLDNRNRVFDPFQLRMLEEMTRVSGITER